MNLQTLLGIDLPIIQAPMAGVQGSALAVAICNAGDLGSLPCAMLAPDMLRAEGAGIPRMTQWNRYRRACETSCSSRLRAANLGSFGHCRMV